MAHPQILSTVADSDMHAYDVPYRVGGLTLLARNLELHILPHYEGVKTLDSLGDLRNAHCRAYKET